MLPFIRIISEGSINRNSNDDLAGKGRGRQVIAVARTADVVIMMLDATKGDVQRCVLLYPTLLIVHVRTTN